MIIKSPSLVSTRSLVTVLASIFVLTIIMMPQQGYAATLSKTFADPGTYEIFFRHPDSTTSTVDPVITFDKNFYHNGDAGILTINDFNANVDRNIPDTISATVGSQTIVLTEDDVDSGVFTGSFTAQTVMNVEYNPDPPDSIRALLSVTTSSPDTEITITDYTLPEGTCVGDGYLATEGITVGSTDAIDLNYIRISYANAVMTLPDNDKFNLRVYHDPDPLITVPGNFVTDIFDEFDGVFSHEIFDVDENGDGIIMDVTADADNAVDAGSPFLPNTGNYILNVAGAGCGGGVGGGIRSSGLVFNVLAGTVAGNTGIDTAPPSLVFSRPSSTGLKFTDALFGSLFAPDPLATISPVTDPSITTPLEINGNGYFLTGYANTIEPAQVSTGENVDLTLSFIEASSVQHVALHFVDENSDEMSDTDPMITFDNGNVIKSDPDGILGDQITFSTSEEGIHSIFNFGFSFDESTNRHLMITAWDEKRNSANTKVYDAFEVSGASIPQEENHLYFNDLGQYVITADGVNDIAEKNIITQQPVVGFDYPDSLGRLDRHDMSTLYDAIDDENIRAGDVMADKFNLDTNTFLVDEQKPTDTRRAMELSWSTVGHKLRDFSKTPEENKELLKELCWQEHLRAQKTLDSLLVQSKYHQE